MLDKQATKYNFQQKALRRVIDLLQRSGNMQTNFKNYYESTLISTRNILQENEKFFADREIQESQEQSKQRILPKLANQLEEIDHKLSIYQSKTCCKGNIEKLLEKSISELSHLNDLLKYIISNETSKKPVVVTSDDNKNYLHEISLLQSEIDRLKRELEAERNKKASPVKLKAKPEVEVKPITDPNSVSIHMSDFLVYKSLFHYVGIEAPISYSKAYDNLNESLKKNPQNPNAIFLLARFYLNGYWIEKNTKRGLSLLKQASELGQSNATIELGKLAQKGVLLPGDKNTLEVKETANYEEFIKHQQFQYNALALKYYKQAALEQENSEGYFILGHINERGLLNSEVNPSRAYDCYTKSVSIDNNPQSLNAIGNFYYSGKVVNKDLKTAFSYYLSSAQRGNKDALNSLGICHEYGKGCDINIPRAMELYDESIKQSHPLAMSNKAILMIKQNTNFDRDLFLQAFKSLLLSVKLHPEENKEAYFNLGFLYEHGYHCNITRLPDSISAYSNYKQAMERGHIKATTKVAIAYSNGIPGVLEKDENIAIKLLRISGDSGDPEALNYLGLYYNLGSSSADKEKSMMYFMKAIEKGDDEAPLNIALLTNAVDEPDEKTPIVDNVMMDSVFQQGKVSIGDEYMNIDSKKPSIVKFTKSSILQDKEILDKTQEEYTPVRNKEKFFEYLSVSAKRGNLTASKLRENIADENLSMLKALKMNTSVKLT